MTGAASLAQSVTAESNKLALDTRMLGKTLDAEVATAAQLITSFSQVANAAQADPNPSKGQNFDTYA